MPDHKKGFDYQKKICSTIFYELTKLTKFVQISHFLGNYKLELQNPICFVCYIDFKNFLRKALQQSLYSIES